MSKPQVRLGLHFFLTVWSVWKDCIERYPEGWPAVASAISRSSVLAQLHVPREFLPACAVSRVTHGTFAWRDWAMWGGWWGFFLLKAYQKVLFGNYVILSELLDPGFWYEFGFTSCNSYMYIYKVIIDHAIFGWDASLVTLEEFATVVFYPFLYLISMYEHVYALWSQARSYRDYFIPGFTSDDFFYFWPY